MKKTSFLLLASCLWFATSCGMFGALRSNTEIGPQDSFVLGNNKHGAFRVNLTNTSSSPIDIHLAPIDGGRHSPQVVQPNQKVTVKVDKNTAVVIGNASTDNVSVKLKVVGDTGLAMEYKK